MPALITHHLFGEDVLPELPAGLVEGEEEVLAFLLGNQGPDPLFARFSTLPSHAFARRRLAHEVQGGRVTRAFLSLRDGVSRLPAADERIGRAFVLGVLGHYALDRAAHPFVIWQQRALVDVDPSLQGAEPEIHAIIDGAYRRCEDILSRCRPELELTARYLLENETMDASTFEKVFSDPAAPEFAQLPAQP